MFPSTILNETNNEPPETEQLYTSYSKGQKILMRDTTPRFNPEGNPTQPQLSGTETFKAAMKSVSLSDFSFEKLTSIPCLRDAGMVGFSSFFVLGTLTFLIHKNPTRATNWAMGGLLLGSIVGWEQCRHKRQRSFDIAQVAIQSMNEKRKHSHITEEEKEQRKRERELARQERVEALKREWESHQNDAATGHTYLDEGNSGEEKRQ